MRLLPTSLLRLPDFRYLALSALLGSVGMMGEVVVLGWLTLQLTNSPFMVGVAMAARTIPLLLLGMPAGVVADRLPRHRLLMATGGGQALMAAALGVLVLAGSVALPQVLTLTFATGCIRAFEQTARQSYTLDIVGPRELVNALALLGVAMRAGWLLGSLALGAFLARLGPGAAYLVVAAGYLGSGVALTQSRAPASGAPPTAGSPWQSLVAFLTAVRRDRVLPVLIALTAGGEVLGFSHQTLLPSLARDVLGVGAAGLGVMTAARSLGGILGMFAVSETGLARGGGALFLATLGVFGGSLVVLGLAPGLVGVVAVLILVNAVGALADIFSQSLLQLSVPAHLRGRAGGAWVVAIGLGPVGQLQIGGLASLLGVSVALMLSGLALITLASAAALLFPRLRSL